MSSMGIFWKWPRQERQHEDEALWDSPFAYSVGSFLLAYLTPFLQGMTRFLEMLVREEGE